MTDELRSKVYDICDAMDGQCVEKSALSKSWRLIFTTEKETLFITGPIAKFFNLGTEVRQIIDLEQGKLQNLITFDNNAAFVVNSTLDLNTGK